MHWKAWHANSCAPPRSWNAPIANCGASSAKSAASAAQRELRWPSCYKLSDSMLAGRSRPGGKPPRRSSSIFSLSTLNEGYATFQIRLLRNFADHFCGMLRVGVLVSFPGYLLMLFLLCLLLLVFSLQALRTVVKHAKLEQMQLSFPIPTSFNEL